VEFLRSYLFFMNAPLVSCPFPVITFGWTRGAFIINDCLRNPYFSDLESEQGNDENKENGGSIAPLFTQVSQASNSTAGPPLLQPLDWLIQPQLDPVPAMVSIECLVLVYVGPK
jgi:hypothetical protein